MKKLYFDLLLYLVGAIAFLMIAMKYFHRSDPLFGFFYIIIAVAYVIKGIYQTKKAKTEKPEDNEVK